MGISTTSRFVAVNGLNIRYLEAGDGPSTILLLHGGGVDSASLSWSGIIPGLAAEHRVIAPDLPGYGQSDRPDAEYTMAFHVDFAVAFIEALGLGRVSVCGLSLGGGIALGLTLDHPNLVAKLVFVDGYGTMATYPFQKLSAAYVKSPLNEFSYWLLARSRRLLRWTLTAAIFDPANLTDELVDEALAEIRAPHAGRAFRSFQRHEIGWHRLRTDFSDRLGEIEVPTLILHGDHDVTVPVPNAHHTHARIRTSRLVMLENRRHWALRDGPDEIVTIILDFLAEPARTP